MVFCIICYGEVKMVLGLSCLWMVEGIDLFGYEDFYKEDNLMFFM